MNKELTEYMATHATSMKTSYKMPNNDLALCGHIAFEIAKLLLSNYHSPYIGIFRSPNGERVYIKKYIDSICKYTRNGFGSHVVCCHDGFIYDPVYGIDPIEIVKYSNTIFTEPLSMHTLVNIDDTKTRNS